jgi:hypothetical protein
MVDVKTMLPLLSVLRQLNYSTVLKTSILQPDIFTTALSAVVVEDLEITL